jgi:NAD+ synthase (glutamine-hydrolysing)
MQYGFIKTAAATPAIRVADCEYNSGEIMKLMTAAHSRGVRLLVLPELCITGYTCGELFLQERLLTGAVEALGKIIEKSRGLQMLTSSECRFKKRKLYNTAAVVF